MCFGWIKVETAVIFLYIIKRSVFITETESVYSAVRTGSYNVMQVTLGFETIYRQTWHAS